MENYVGVKIIKAEPEDKSGLKGYRVMNPDGEISWMPKEVFESTFQKMDMSFVGKEQ